MRVSAQEAIAPKHRAIWVQILGEEARSRVPAEFVVQDPTAANPPTLFLALADMARLVAKEDVPGTPADPERQEELEFLRAGQSLSPLLVLVTN